MRLINATRCVSIAEAAASELDDVADKALRLGVLVRFNEGRRCGHKWRGSIDVGLGLFRAHHVTTTRVEKQQFDRSTESRDGNVP